jgi:DNA-binding PadR family transcriptional regulator
VNSSETQAIVPHHRERQLMQHLRAGAWVKATAVTGGPILIANLLKKGWIERRGTGAQLYYRITEKGLAAKKLPVPIYSHKRSDRADGEAE